MDIQKYVERLPEEGARAALIELLEVIEAAGLWDFLPPEAAARLPPQ